MSHSGMVNRVLGIATLLVLMSCTSQELQSLGRDVAHNVGCDQQYEGMPKEEALRDDCLRTRP